MSVKRYEWMACDGHACHCDVVESAEGDMVDYEDYAALEAKCAALAAENAGLKNGNGTAIEFRDFYAWWNIFNEDGLRTEDERMLAAGAWMARSGLGNTDTYQYVPAVTQATDAFLAEVRAQGVEMCSAEMQKQTWDEREGDGLFAAIDAMEIYAAQLRKGGA